jgi:16S rRNA U516 pseudouridylate synthase RsuA-like enzyme
LETYHLKLKSLLTFEEVESLSRSARARISRLRSKNAPWYEVTLSEANREMLWNRFYQSGHPVEKMKRIAMAGTEIGSLAPGRYRPLTDAELAKLRRAIDDKHVPASQRPSPAFRAPGAAVKRPSRPNRPDRRNPRKS